MNPTQPSKRLWLIALIIFWALYGLSGRDAWKPEEALNFGHMMDWQSGKLSAWSTPVPLYTVTAGTLASILPPLIESQDAARLASGLFVLLAMSFIGIGARSMFGPGFGTAAALSIMSSFGLMLLGHALLPETALLATWAILLCGIAVARKRSEPGAWLIGLALILCTFGLRGLPDLLAALLVLLTPLSFKSWREREYQVALFQGLLMATLVVIAGLIWMGMSGRLSGWWSNHSLAWAWTFRSPARIYPDLAWAAWPLWPLALAGIWHAHRRLARTAELQPLLIALVVALAQALLPVWSRDGGLLPVLAPLALLAAYGLEDLRRGAAQSLYWFGVLCFLFFTLAFWVYFSAIEWGWPPGLAAHMARLTPSYVRGNMPSASIFLAMAATIVWIIAIPLFPRAKHRPVLVWATGMTLTWVLVIALFRPWIEIGWGYRPLLVDMARHLPKGACVRAEVDPAMRVMLRHHLGISGSGDCRYVLRQVHDRGERRHDGAVVLWEGVKPRVKSQHYRLERE